MGTIGARGALAGRSNWTLPGTPSMTCAVAGEAIARATMNGIDDVLFM
jgi:hypothetical protein